MAFRGYAALDGTEIANSSRVIAHLASETPTMDAGMFVTSQDCSLTPMRPNRISDPGFYDPAQWPVAGSSAGVFRDTTVTRNDANTLRLEGGDGTIVTAYLLPGGSSSIATAGGELIRNTAWVRTPVGSGNIVLRMSMRYDDTVGFNATAYSSGTQGYVQVTPGVWTFLSSTFTTPAGYNQARPRVDLGPTSPAGSIGWVSEPTSDRLLDPDMPGLFQIPDSSVEVMPGLFSPPNGSRLMGPGLFQVAECWTPANLCTNCRTQVMHDDSWPGLAEMLGDVVYRPEIAPWYDINVPQSAEFGGIWLMDVTGLDVAATNREISELAGDGGAPGPARIGSRAINFEALLIACSNAGLTYGLKWLTSILQETNEGLGSTLQYLAAHPGWSAVDPELLIRELHGVVLTGGPDIRQSIRTGGRQNEQATMYRITWDMVATRPHCYSPPIDLDIDWDTIELKNTQWIHAADCSEPSDCADMPVMFSTECSLEEIEIVTSPPPVCGGCMPVCQVEQRVFNVPTFAYPILSDETAVSIEIENTGGVPLTIQGHWRVCYSDARCDDSKWPIQVSGLPAATKLVLDGISGRYWTEYDDRKWRPMGIVGTPTGAPWVPPLIDRAVCWEFVVTCEPGAVFDVKMSMADREA